jgi:hypothetical protein
MKKRTGWGNSRHLELDLHLHLRMHTYTQRLRTHNNVTTLLGALELCRIGPAGSHLALYGTQIYAQTRRELALARFL